MNRVLWLVSACVLVAATIAGAGFLLGVLSVLGGATPTDQPGRAIVAAMFCALAFWLGLRGVRKYG